MDGSEAHEVPSRAADAVVASIRDDIVSGRVCVGHPLGCEDELRAEHGVARATLREALRVLESEGFVRVRRGPGGGVFAHLPMTVRAAASLVPHFLIAGADADDVEAARALLDSLRRLPGYQGNRAIGLLSEVISETATAMPKARRSRFRAA